MIELAAKPTASLNNELEFLKYYNKYIKGERVRATSLFRVENLRGPH
jgi:hypothetical protein